MIFILFPFSFQEKNIVYYPDLEKRSADSICQYYQSNFQWQRPNSCYTEGEGCTYGVHNEKDIEMTTKRVNFFRKISGLITIPTSTNNDLINRVNQASLIMDKNDVFSHDLSDKNLKCWSEAGKIGASNSNIYMSPESVCSTDSILYYIDDSNTESLGHRRWVLNPELSQVAAGVAQKHSAMLMNGITQGKSGITNFLAYPPPGPVPSDIIFSNWSFSRSYTDLYSDNHNKMPKDTRVRVKCNSSVISIQSTLLDSDSSNYPGIVKFDMQKVNPGTFCKVVVSSESENIEWRYTVQAIKCVDGKAENVNPDAFNDKDYDFDGGGKKKKNFPLAAKIGIVVAVVVVAGAIIFFWILFKTKLEHLC